MAAVKEFNLEVKLPNAPHLDNWGLLEGAREQLQTSLTAAAHKNMHPGYITAAMDLAFIHFLTASLSVHEQSPDISLAESLKNALVTSIHPNMSGSIRETLRNIHMQEIEGGDVSAYEDFTFDDEAITKAMADLAGYLENQVLDPNQDFLANLYASYGTEYRDKFIEPNTKNAAQLFSSVISSIDAESLTDVQAGHVINMQAMLTDVIAKHQQVALAKKSLEPEKSCIIM